MNTEVQNLYERVTLADASYANLANYTAERSVIVASLQERGFAKSEAESLLAHWTVFHSQPDMASGFSATLFQSNADVGDFVLALRGTQGLVDIVDADVADIVADGLAIKQIVDLYNYWQRLTAPKDGSYRIAELAVMPMPAYVPGMVQPPLPIGCVRDFPSGLAYRLEFHEAPSSDGLGVTASKIHSLSVTGHSLGGHLAVAFARLFADRNPIIYTENGAGFRLVPNVDRLLDGLAGRVTDFDTTRILNVYGSAGPQFISQDTVLMLTQYGERIEIFTEEMKDALGHGIAQMTQAAGVMDLLFELGSNLGAATARTAVAGASALFEAASLVPGFSTEAVANALGKALLPGYVPIAPAGQNDRTVLMDHLATMRAAFLDAAGAPRPGYANLTLVPTGTDATMLATAAHDSLAWRAALVDLSPFTLVAPDAAATTALYAHRDTAGELSSLSAHYLEDRAAMLALQNVLGPRDMPLLDDGCNNIRVYRDYAASGALALDLSAGDSSAMDVRWTTYAFGNAAADTLIGYAGTDHLYGGANGDVLAGGGGADVLEGDGGDDALTGGEAGRLADGAPDLLLGGTGFDRYTAADGDVIDDADGRGSITVVGLDGAPHVISGRSAKLMQQDADAGVYYTSGEAPEVYRLAADGTLCYLSAGTVTIAHFHDGDFGITLDAAPTVIPDLVLTVGTADADALGFGDRNDELRGEGGDDTLSGYGGRDLLVGGTGRDLLLGGDGADALEGGTEADLLAGDAGEDRLDGGAGRDLLSGGSGNDAVSGGPDDDLVSGGGGSDVLAGGDGNDLLLGNVYAGAYDMDFSMTHGPAAAPNVLRDPRNYTLSHIDVAVEYAVNHPDAGDAAPDALFGEAGDDDLIGGPGGDLLDGGDGDDTAAGAGGDDVLRGGSGDDHLQGNGGSDQIDGGEGADFLVGFGAFPGTVDGDDYLDGGAGDDLLFGEAPLEAIATGNDTLLGGEGDDQLVGNAGDDRLFGGSGADRLFGDDDRVPAVSGNDYLDGGAGDDVLRGGPGDDQLDGGDGADTLLGDEAPADAFGADRLAGGNGDDLLVGGGGADRLYGNAGSDLLLGDGNATFVVAHGDQSADYLDGGEDDDSLYGGAGNDVLLGGSGRDVLYGGAGDDALDGGPDADTLWGEDGLDRLAGGEGADLLYGGADDDVLDGGEGGDVLAGEAGRDVLDGRAGDDVLWGGDDGDVLRGGDGRDVLHGEAGADTLDGGAGDDVIDGGDGSDHLDGADGDDSLAGDAGDDALAGGGGSDVLAGGLGDDALEGGSGHDVYLVASGDGGDTLSSTAGFDIARFLDLTANAVTIELGAEALRIATPDGMTRLVTGVTAADCALDALVFQDGTTLMRAHFADGASRGRYFAAGTGTVDAEGTAGDDLFAVPATHYACSGGAGDDVYFHTRASTRGEIRDTAGVDTLVLGDGIAPGDLALVETAAGDLDITIGNASITVYDWAHAPLERFVFADGTAIETPALEAAIEHAPRLVHEAADRRWTNGEAVRFTLAADMFADADAWDALTYTATRADGSALPGWLDFDAATRTFSGTAEAPAGQSFTVTVTAADRYGQQAADSFTVDVLGDWSLARLDGVQGYASPASGGAVITEAAVIGDVNGDGCDDVLVIAETGGGVPPAPYVVNGHAGAGAATLAREALEGTNGFAITGFAAGSRVLHGAALGDVNGDGLADFGIGVESGSGTVHVVYGRAEGFGQTLDLANLDAASGMTITGVAGTRFGAALAAIGDIDGDGCDDFAIGAPEARVKAALPSGEVDVVFGARDLPGRLTAGELQGVHGFRLLGDGAATHAGAALASAGDYNGDGYADLLIGAPGSTSADTGRAYVVFGHAGGYPSTLELAQLASGIEGLTIHGNTPGSRLGASVGRAGDIDGDGLPEIVIGAPGMEAGGTTGRAYVLHGVVGAPTDVYATSGATIAGLARNDGFGALSPTPGDFNGDGYDDLLLAAPQAAANGAAGAGVVALVYGGPDWDPRGYVDLAAPAGADLLFSGVAPRDGLGRALGFGDTNGDGRSDALLVSPGAGSAGATNGTAYVVAGGIVGDARAEVLIGTAQADVVRAFGGDDRVSGGPGADALYGGLGDDTLSGEADRDLLFGEAGDDVLNGGEGTDSLYGGAGRDELIGGAGIDYLVGGAGDDVYRIDSTFDKIVEQPGEGIDTVYSTASLGLPAHVENLVLLSARGQGLFVAGNEGDNTMIGGAGSEFIASLNGNDVLRGGPGADRLRGGAGDDRYEFARGDGFDVIDDQGGGFDTLRYDAGIAATALWWYRGGNDLYGRVLGSDDGVVVSGWYGTYPRNLERVELADGLAITNTRLAALVDAMAAFAPPTGPGHTVTPEALAALEPVIAASWQPAA
ncbi:MAG: FG-GAP repeat protein [Gammaproteobacteria bacterium]|nr:FG-GAP repeat protein [Gammaproteobacteria bacterium]